MPIANSTKPIVTPVPEKVQVYSDDYQSIAVDTSETPIASIITYVEGSPWTTDCYYSQVVNKDDELKPLDINISQVNQQYTAIKGLVLKVTAGLTPSQDQQSKQFTVTGTATVYPFVIPNVGDMFVADAGNGRLGLFTVTLAEQKTILKETCYAIEYGMVSILSDAQALNLKEKTIKTVFFKAERAALELNPVLVEEEALTVDKLKRLRKELIAGYISMFYSLEFKTLKVPEQSTRVYDPFVVELFLRTVDSDEHPTIRRMKELNVDGTIVSEALTWVDGLINLSQSYFTDSFQRVKIAATSWFDYLPHMDGINYSGFDSIVYPDTLDATYEQQSYRKPVLIVGLQRRSPLPTHNFFAPITNDRYVFSGSFYNNDHDGTLLEIMVRKMMNQERIASADLFVLIDALKTAAALDKFYYLPILLMIMRYVSIKL